MISFTLFFSEDVIARMIGFGKKAHNLFLSIASGRTKIKGVNIFGDNSVTDEKKFPKYCTASILSVDADAGAIQLKQIDDEKFQAIADQAVSFLEVIFKEHAGMFLLQVVSGRFSTL